MSDRKDDDEEEVNSEAGEEGKNPCSIADDISALLPDHVPSAK